ncbi:protein FAM210A-like isoform X2 [Neocloeon triangulifer]|uniref:protein FAM210A-like isoform X2 n=1 Tax=Neocloeon triangulifer TaxID=2078957 RepID=UPI00286F47B5|nr:protein FAM210A-like isoform X2 [Neocloeon triangulifer]
MIRQVASLGLRHAFRVSAQPSRAIASGKRTLPNNTNSILTAGFSSKVGDNKQQPLEVPTNIEKSDAAQRAVFHLHTGQDVHPTYQPQPAEPSSGQSSYDYNKTVSLHSVMQSNVPQPFAASGKAPSHLNMPGGQHTQDSKYLAHEQQNLHASKKEEAAEAAPVVEELSRKERFKRAVKEYGATLIVFHVSISLLSLGGCYTAVSSGLDLAAAVQRLGLEISTPSLASAGTFVVAYAVHKVFAPVRISITLAAVPLLVKYFRVKKRTGK